MSPTASIAMQGLAHAAPSPDSARAEEKALLARARQGDGPAFGLLVRRHQHRAMRLAWRILRDDALAEDAVQEAFLKAYTSLDRFEGRSRFYTWLYRLVVNECLDRKRRQKRELLGVGSSEDPIEAASAALPAPEVMGVAFHPAAQLARSELRAQLAQALEKLSHEGRQAILLREVDGLSYSEIAKAEDIPVGTVMSRLHYARRRLRELLEESQVVPSAAGAAD